ncbi:MAG: putative ABC transporter ATP-binding protein YbbL [Candidatus Hydrogenedentes bacterium ADurb.Bin179]|nr:MAG: putative ABC transporter ATP-binding protein YbbL [Candidatus Hydrogenedentes bacterium ADurb.Bin179]
MGQATPILFLFSSEHSNRPMKNIFILDVNNVSVIFGKVPLFSSLYLSMHAGEKVTLSGPSGSGKSTLLRCIVGFAPFSGFIHINGEPLNRHTVWRLRRQVAYVDQEPDLGPGQVREALKRPFSYKANQAVNFDPHGVDMLFERFLLPQSLQSKEIRTLSGGEKQRVALVVALLLKRPLLLLDEAASALDANSKQQVREYLCEQSELTILSVSHDTRDFTLSNSVFNIEALKKEQAR